MACQPAAAPGSSRGSSTAPRGAAPSLRLRPSPRHTTRHAPRATSSPRHPATPPPRHPATPALYALSIACPPQGLVEPTNARLQVGFLNILNLIFWDEAADVSSDDGGALEGSGASVVSNRSLRRLREQLLNPRVLTAVVRAVDRGASMHAAHSPTARAKALLALRLVASRQPSALVQALERGLLPKLEKLVSEPEELEAQPYLRQCALSLLTFLTSTAVNATATLALELAVLLPGGPQPHESPGARPGGAGRNRDAAAVARLEAAVSAFPAVAHLVAANVVNEAIVLGHPDVAGDAHARQDGRFLENIAVCVRATQGGGKGGASWSDVFPVATTRAGGGGGGGGGGSAAPPPGFTRGELQRLLLLVLQGLGRHAELLLAPQAPAAAADLVPAICGLLVDESGDTRANAVSLLRLVLPGLINEQVEATDAGVRQPAGNSATGVFVQGLLPLCSGLVADRDPIPQVCFMNHRYPS